MKYQKHIVMQCAYLYIVLIVLCLWKETSFSECIISNRINEIQTESLLGSSILDWNKDRLLNKYCYFEIGKKYFELFKADKSQSTLKNAIKYLEYASKQLTIRDSHYSECCHLLFEAASCEIPINIVKLIEYKKSIRGINIQKNENVRINIQKAMMPIIHNYKKDPFRCKFPDQLINNINLISETYGIHIDVDLASVKKIQQLVIDYNAQLEHLKTNQSYEQVETVLSLLDRLLQIQVKNVPKSNTIRALQLYHELYTNNLKPAHQKNSCEQFTSALNNFAIANKSLPYLTDILHIHCHKQLACLLDEVESKIQKLMPDAQDRNQYTNNLDACEQYQARFHEAKRKCSNVQSRYDTPVQLNDLIKFYRAYNSLAIDKQTIHPTNMLTDFMRNIKVNKQAYALNLYNLAGFHLADYYYQKSYKLLSKKPSKNRNQTLEQIRIVNDRLKDYKDFIQMPNNVIDQYSKLLNFISSFHLKSASELETTLSEIDYQIREAWGLDELLNDRIKDSQRGVGRKEQKVHVIKKKIVLESEQEKNQKRTYSKNAKNISTIDLTIDHFEKFATFFQQSYEKLTCEIIQKYFQELEINSNYNCLTTLLSQVRRGIRQSNDAFRYYFALASIRKAEKDYFNWIENLCIAYDSIPRNGNLNQASRQTKVKKELALAKIYMHNKILGGKSLKNLKNVGLLKEWRSNTFIQQYLDVFTSPKDARATFNTIDCTYKFEIKTRSLQKLLTTYRLEKEDSKCKEYTEIFNKYINSCNCTKEKVFWIEDWYQ